MCRVCTFQKVQCTELLVVRSLDCVDCAEHVVGLVYCTGYSVQCIVCSVYCAVYIVQCAVQCIPVQRSAVQVQADLQGRTVQACRTAISTV